MADERRLENARRAVRMVVMDVDGVLTDGSIVLIPGGGPDGAQAVESKSFNVKDGLAIRWAARLGLVTAILTSRASPAVARRAEELAIAHVITGAPAKAPAFLTLCETAGVAPEEAAYLGDDLPDLGPMALCGLAIAVADAAPEVREAALWVTEAPGGRGAVREALEGILRTQGLWQRVVDSFRAEEPGAWTG